MPKNCLETAIEVDYNESGVDKLTRPTVFIDHLIPAIDNPHMNSIRPNIVGITIGIIEDEVVASCPVASM